MEADKTGSIVVDIWKQDYANYPPTNTETITSASPLTISGGVKCEDEALSGWTIAFAAGDILAFNVDSCTTVTRVVIALKVAKT
ncbi:hypothetical protein ES703_116717 [subsurface metagenome]